VIRRRRAILIGVLLAAVCLVVGRAISALYVDYEWYAAVGAREVWLSRVTNTLILTTATVLVAALFLFANLYAVRRSIVAVVLPRRVANIEIGQEVPGRFLTGAGMLVSLLLGIGLALPPEPWSEFALARFGLPFGESEPYFQSDLGFFVYWLPLESALYVRALVLLMVTTCAVVVLYFALTPSLRWERNHLTVSSRVRRHGAVLTACIFCALAWSYRLDAYGLLNHGSGPAGAFTYADHHFGIPANRALAVLTVAAGLVTAAALWRGQVRTAFGVVTATILLPIVVFRAVPLFLPRGVESAENATHEQPYAVIRAIATRQAYGVRRLGAAEAQRGFASRRDAAAGTSAWDPGALTLALDRTAHRHVIPGAIGWERSPNGLLAAAVDRGDGGQGAALLRVLAGVADDRGLPVRTDSLGRPSLDDQPIPPVLLYEGAVGPAIVADSTERIAAPRIDGWLARLAHAWSAQNLSLISADLPDPHPKILQRRDVRERVDALVPFFAQGSTVWPAVVGDSLYWVLHLYSSADTYPLSEHFDLAHDERSYFQHAATAFVHAYTGRVTLVADETLDPIAQTWVRQFPTLFAHAAELPPRLAAAVPPPIDGAVAMATAFAAIGARMSPAPEPIARQRAIVVDGSDSAAAGDEPPCLALSTGPPSCTWSIPLVDAGERVTGLVVAQGGMGGAVRWWPLVASGSGMRWSPALDRLDRAGDSALATRHDGTLARGRVRALLVVGQLSLVQPVYEWHADAPPALARVAVATSDSAWSAATLAEAMTNRASAGDSLLVRMSQELGGADFRARVEALYDSMRAALKRGDMAAFGAAYASLGRLLGRTP